MNYIWANITCSGTLLKHRFWFSRYRVICRISQLEKQLGDTDDINLDDAEKTLLRSVIFSLRGQEARGYLSYSRSQNVNAGWIKTSGNIYQTLIFSKNFPQVIQILEWNWVRIIVLEVEWPQLLAVSMNQGKRQEARPWVQSQALHQTNKTPALPCLLTQGLSQQAFGLPASKSPWALAVKRYLFQA